MHRTANPRCATAVRALTLALLPVLAAPPANAGCTAASAPHGGRFRLPDSPAPIPGLPGLPQPGPAGLGPAGPSTVGGGARETDRAAWSQWWSLSRDLFLPRAESVFDGRGATGAAGALGGAGLRVPAAQLHDAVIPALLRVLDKERDVDLVTSSLMALAKIGTGQQAPDDADLVEVLAGFLRDGNQEVAETAAVALGVLGDRGGAALLAELLHQSREGGAAVGSRSVPRRTRAFAAYGLAALGARSHEPAVRSFVVHHLAAELEEIEAATPDLAVACVLGLGHVRLEVTGAGVTDEPAPAESREGQVAFLASLLRAKGLDETVAGYVPVALARLAEGATPELERTVAEELLELLGARKKVDPGIRAGAIHALGMLGDDDLDPVDVAIREALIEATGGGDRLQRHLALVALGRIGGRMGGGERKEVAAELRDLLLKRLERGDTAERPWAALATGLLERGRIDAGEPPFLALRLTLRLAFESEGSPSLAGALAIAIGLTGDLDAVAILMRQLGNGDESVRGHAATALGLLRARDAIPALRELVLDGRRPGLAREAAIALALIGDKEIWRSLVEVAKTDRFLYHQLSALLALGYVADSRAAAPLLEVLGGKRVKEPKRAFAAVALGILCDKDRVPWNFRLAQDAGWWDAPSTLFDPYDGRGIVDIF